MPESDQAARSYRNIVRAITETPWAILPSTFMAIREVIALRVDGHQLSVQEIEQRISGGPGRGRAQTSGAVAVVPLYGVLVPRANVMTAMSGGTSLQQFGAALSQAASNPEVGSILIDVDSPGGAVELVTETAAMVRAAGKKKPIVAVANTMAGSAAYWIASQAGELIVTPSGMVGSVGVFASHEDLSGMQEKAGVDTTLISAGRFKTEGHPFGPLDDEARATIQSLVDGHYAQFVADVAKGRGVRRDDVRGGFGEGRMVPAATAVTEGMADSVGTFDETLSRLIRGDAGSGPKATGGLVTPESAAALFDLDVEAITSPDEPPDDEQSSNQRERELLAEIQDKAVQTTTAIKEATK